MIHIEICNSPWKNSKGKFNIRIGDIEGSTSFTNITFAQVMNAIKSELEKTI